MAFFGLFDLLIAVALLALLVTSILLVLRPRFTAAGRAARVGLLVASLAGTGLFILLNVQEFTTDPVIGSPTVAQATGTWVGGGGAKLVLQSNGTFTASRLPPYAGQPTDFPDVLTGRNPLSGDGTGNRPGRLRRLPRERDLHLLLRASHPRLHDLESDLRLAGREPGSVWRPGAVLLPWRPRRLERSVRLHAAMNQARTRDAGSPTSQGSTARRGSRPSAAPSQTTTTAAAHCRHRYVVSLAADTWSRPPREGGGADPGTHRPTSSANGTPVAGRRRQDQRRRSKEASHSVGVVVAGSPRHRPTGAYRWSSAGWAG